MIKHIGFFFRSKQVNLPYPQEHPYASHISRYNLFPHPTHHPPSLPQPPQLTITSDSPEKTTEHQQEVDQTEIPQYYNQPETPSVDHLPCTPRHPYYVNQKAADFGLRVETVVPSCSTNPLVVIPKVEHVLWQLPKDFPHKVSVLCGRVVALYEG